MLAVLHDSGELIQCPGGGVKLPADCLLVTADVSSLYPNIDTKKALIAFVLLLREGKVAQTPLLVQFTWLVFENKFLQSELSCDIYHQTYGIAMGTPFFHSFIFFIFYFPFINYSTKLQLIMIHLAGSPGSYFAYLKDCLKKRSKKLECKLSIAEQKY